MIISNIIKYVVGTLFLVFASGLISLAVLEIFGYADVSIYVTWGIWAVILFIYGWNAELEKYPQYKQTPWEARAQYVGDLCSFMFMALLYTLGSLAVLGILLRWILVIDILETEYSHRLTLLAWGGWFIGIYCYHFKHRKE